MTRKDRHRIKQLIELMQARAFELRQMTGRGQTREQLLNDPTWRKLNDEYEQLQMK